jgi:hypothetical protein
MFLDGYIARKWEQRTLQQSGQFDRDGYYFLPPVAPNRFGHNVFERPKIPFAFWRRDLQAIRKSRFSIGLRSKENISETVLLQENHALKGQRNFRVVSSAKWSTLCDDFRCLVPANWRVSLKHIAVTREKRACEAISGFTRWSFDDLQTMIQ